MDITEITNKINGLKASDSATAIAHELAANINADIIDDIDLLLGNTISFIIKNKECDTINIDSDGEITFIIYDEASYYDDHLEYIPCDLAEALDYISSRS